MNTRQLTITATLVAICALVIMLLHVPTVGSEYVHLGDSIIYIAACLLNPMAAAIVGGLGGACADLMSGYAMWAPFTLVVKGTQGFICAWILHRLKQNKIIWQSIAMIIATAVMCVGYFFASWILAGSFEGALAGIPMNLVQGAIGAVIAIILMHSGINKLDGFIHKDNKPTDNT